MILLETTQGSNKYTPVYTVDEFRELSGIEPVMKRECSHISKRKGCLCGIDAQATAEKGNFDLDIGDKHDMHSYLFKFKESRINPNWPSTTGRPSGKFRGNNPPG